ncbi:hypothetical protein MTP10_02325 [Nonomuraea sp. 3-1Str]|uniref:hypothetical protein n=1 Tax=Nonomuraea sp. 3-1Str TaxID=2929801 RepID=UPI002854C54C|nr:hypothetical protein [Nonomuraea sp. 3-1Str]MDR8407573.1 hypothetical protein [Nonomuraea sp. 3-1Str]
MLTRSRPALAVLGVAALAVLGGCGSAAESARPAPSSTPGAASPMDKRHQLEAAKADCMKQQGFKYVPHVTSQGPDTEESRKRTSGDYQALRKYREKYGFGVFAMHVYPKEMGNPQVKPDDAEIDPNMKIQSGLSEAQTKAYRKAKDTCMTTAVGQVLGLKVKSEMDLYNAQNRAMNRALKGAINGDPDMVELAAAMATCLKGKGYTVGDTSPVAMNESGQKAFLAQEDRLGREQLDDVPDVAPPAKDGELPMTYAPTLTPEQARPYLAKEIKAALDDLECGKDFYRAYMPKQAAIVQRISDQYGT